MFNFETLMSKKFHFDVCKFKKTLIFGKFNGTFFEMGDVEKLEISAIKKETKLNKKKLPEKEVFQRKVKSLIKLEKNRK